MAEELSANQAAPRPRKAVNVVLWLLQALVAVLFVMAGPPKIVATDQFIQQAPWAQDVPRTLLIFIGTMEVLGAIGLVGPRMLKVLPWLTPLAAAGLATLMLFSIVFHLSRAEWNVALNVVLGGMAGFVAYGRWKLVP